MTREVQDLILARLDDLKERQDASRKEAREDTTRLHARLDSMSKIVVENKVAIAGLKVRASVWGGIIGLAGGAVATVIAKYVWEVLQ